MKLHALAPAKVNLGLFVGPPRSDGRHQLASAIESVSLADELTLQTLATGEPDTVLCPGVEGRNLVDETLAALRAAGWAAPPVRIEAAKRIPIAGGMAGGSADAGATLRMAMVLGGLERGAAASIAASLGSDVPSQLAPGLFLATGAGDTIEAREPLAAHAFVLLALRPGLATPDVYAKADELALPRESDDLQERCRELDRSLKPGARLPSELCVNDLERATSALHPDVSDALGDARVAGADVAFVCGSGPTVAGLFWGDDASDRAVAAAAQLIELYPSTLAALPVGADFGMPQRI